MNTAKRASRRGLKPLSSARIMWNARSCLRELKKMLLSTLKRNINWRENRLRGAAWTSNGRKDERNGGKKRAG